MAVYSNGSASKLAEWLVSLQVESATAEVAQERIPNTLLLPVQTYADFGSKTSRFDCGWCWW